MGSQNLGWIGLIVFKESWSLADIEIIYFFRSAQVYLWNPINKFKNCKSCRYYINCNTKIYQKVSACAHIFFLLGEYEHLKYSNLFSREGASQPQPVLGFATSQCSCSHRLFTTYLLTLYKDYIYLLISEIQFKKRNGTIAFTFLWNFSKRISKY